MFDILDEPSLEIVISDGWLSIYIRDLVGLDFYILNSLLLVASVFVFTRVLKVIKKSRQNKTKN